MDKTYELYYRESITDCFQGTKSELNKRLRRTGECIVAGGNGSWIVSTPPERKIYEYVNGEPTRCVCPDRFLRIERGMQRITRRSCEKLVEDLNLGKVDFSKLF